MLVTLTNPSTDDLKKTYLAQSYNFGTTSIEVRSNLEFTNTQRILIGEPGLSSSEVVTAGTISANGTTIAIGATLYPHEADTPIYLLQFDQAKFYRSTTGISGNYSLLDTVNIDFTSANLETTYDDTSAQAGYYYKITVFNSITSVESAFSDPIPALTGWARNQVGYVINSMYEELSDVTEANFSRDEIIGYMNEVNDDLLAQVVRPYNFLYTRQAFARVAASNTLAWPTDSFDNNLMWKFDRIDYNFVDNTTNPVTDVTYTVPVVDLTYFRNRHTTNQNDSTTQDDMVQEIALDESQHTFNYYPYSATSSNTVWYLYYWSTFTTLSSEGDSIQTPTPKIYKHYIAYKYYLKKSVAEPDYLTIANTHYRDYTRELLRLKSQDRRDVGTPRSFHNSGWVNKGIYRYS